MPTDLRIDADNRPGVLAAIAGALGSAGVNIVGYCGVGAGGKGSIHLLVDDAGARKALEGSPHAIAAEHEALLVENGVDRPGYLAEITQLGDAGHQRRGRVRRQRHPGSCSSSMTPSGPATCSDRSDAGIR